jgi:hypothetical protein
MPIALYYNIDVASTKDTTDEIFKSAESEHPEKEVAV